jgi:hypothetical protein
LADSNQPSFVCSRSLQRVQKDISPWPAILDDFIERRS